VVNALVLILASLLAPGFRVRGFVNAMIGSLVLTILTIILTWLVW
jgi:putative membrane protein